jgi:hypothetical protein
LFILTICLNSCVGDLPLPSDSNNEENTDNGESNVSNATRCAAITKSGTQCKRNAEKGDIYCWQHKK